MTKSWSRLLFITSLTLFMVACGDPPPEDDIPPNQLRVIAHPPTTVAAGSEIPIQLEIVDFLGQRVTAGPDASANITISLVSGDGSLIGNQTVAASDGLVNFAGSGLSIGQTGIKNLIAVKEDTPFSPSLSVPLNAFSVTHGPASQLVYATQPASPTLAGAEIASLIEIHDAYGNKVTSGIDSTANISISLQSGTGSLNGTTSVAATAGVANFTGQNLNIAALGFKTLRATKADTSGSGGSSAFSVDSASFEIASPAAHHLLITAQPSDPTAAGSEITFVVEIQDIIGNAMTTGPDATADITLTLQNGTGTLGGSLTVSALNGVASFSGSGLNIDLVGSKILRATKADTSGSGGTAALFIDSNAFTIVNAPAHHLTYINQPLDPTTSLTEVTTTIEIRDIFENVVTTGPDATAPVNISLLSGTGSLSGNTTVAAVNGVIQLSGQGTAVDLIGPKVLRFEKSDTSGSGGTGILQIDSATFTISHGPASQLVVVSQPADPILAGDLITLGAELRDSAGNIITSGVDSTANISLSLQSGAGTLGGTLTVPAVSGAISFTATESLNIDLVGAKVLRATKEDTSGSGGTASFAGDSNGFTIQHNVATQMTFTTQPTDPTEAYSEISSIVEIHDAYGNLVTTGVDSSANVTINLQSGTGTLGGATSKAAVGGVTDFTGTGLNIDLQGPGKILRATKADTSGSGGTGSVQVDSIPFAISAPLASQLVFTTQPANPTVAGMDLLPVIEIQDAGGSVITTGPDATANITLSIQSGTGSIGGVLTVAAVNGVASFTATEGVYIDLQGAKTLRAAKEDTSGSGGTGALIGDSTSFFIVHGPATQLYYSTEPADPTEVLADLLPIIEIQDSFGNIVVTGVDATASVNLTLQSGSGSLGGTPSVAAINGVATFTASEGANIDTVGTGKVLRATKADTSGSGGTTSFSTDSAAFEIVPGSASQLVFTTQPAHPTIAGNNLLPVIEIRDGNGFPITNGPDATATITLTLQSGTGTLLGTASVSAVAGVATFTATEALNLNIAGSKILRAAKADTSGSGGTGALFVDSTSFDIQHAAASQISYLVQPGSPTEVGAEISVGLALLDAYGNSVTTGPDSTANVSISVQTGSGSLSGTQVKAAVSGVIDFSGSNLAYSTAETGVILRAIKADTSGSGGTSSMFVDSNPFNVTWPSASQLVFTTQPSNPTTAGSDLLPVIEIRDSGGQPITAGPDATAQITINLQSGTGTLTGTLTVTAIAGVASFTATEAVNIDLIGNKVLRATKEDTTGSGGTSPLTADSASFSIIHAPAAQLAFTTQPANPSVVGTSLLPVIEIRDSYGNLVDSGIDSTANVTLNLQSGSGNLNGSVSVTAVNGVATFTATEAVNIDDVGTGKVLRATKADTSGSGGTTSVVADSNSFSIIAGAASQLVFVTQPADPTGAGLPLLPVIEIRDANGFVVTTGADASAQITLSLQSGTGPLAGTVTLTAVNGVATFTGTENVHLDQLGSKVLRATKEDTSGSGGTASVFVDSSSFNIIHGLATQVVVTASPTDPSAQSSPLTLTAEIRDAYDNIVSSGVDATANISLSLVAGTGVLSGTTSKSASAGVVNFGAAENIQINLTGTGKVLRATKADTSGSGGTGSLSADSASFEVIAFSAPSGLALKNPVSSPANDTTPEVTVSGVTSGNTITLYKNSTCTGTPVASGVASGTSIDLTASPALIDGAYNFYANQDNGSITSPCSTATVQYVLATSTPPVPTLLLLYDPAVSPDIDDTPTIQVSGVNSGHTIRLYRNSTCTTEVGSGVASSSNILISSSALPGNGVYTFYAKAEFASMSSTCSTASVQYELDTTLTPLSSPTSLSLYDPATSPGNDPSPIIQVGGVVSGDSVFLYSDVSCTNLVGFNTATNTSVYIQSGALANGTYDFYATRNNSSGSMSACSTATVQYEVSVTPPTAPTGLSLHVPSVSPNNDSTPTIMVSGVSSGNVVKLYKDSACTQQVGSSTSTGSTIALTSTALTEGVYDFYALQTNGAVSSSCSTATVSYEYTTAVTLPDPPTSLALQSPTYSPDIDTTPTITVNGVASGDTVKLFADSGCTLEVASSIAAGTSINLTTATLSVGSYKFYANRTDLTPETSNCSSSYVNYEVTDTIQLDDFQSGLGNWSNVTGDDEDWTIRSGNTPSSNVGPSSGYLGSGQYVYTEASSPVKANDLFYLESNSLNAGTNQLAVSFKWNKRGSNMGNLYLEVSTDGGSTWDNPAWSHLGADVPTGGSDVWKNGNVDLCGLGYTSGNIKLRFRGLMPSGGTIYESDIAIDQVRVYNSSCSPPLNVAITHPSTNFEINRSNYYSYLLQGTCSQSGGSIEISGEVSATATCYSGTWSTNLDFTGVANGPIHLNIRHIFGSLEGSTTLDLNLDTTVIQHDDFEIDFGNWTNVTSGDDFDWSINSGETPSSGVGPTSSYDGSQYVYTEASSPANNNDVFIMESNSFDAGSDNIEVNFYYNKRGDNMGDLYLEASSDGGTTWAPIWSHLGADIGRNGTDVWRSQTVDACASGYNSGNVKFRFRVVLPPTGSAFHSDIGLDAITIKDGDCL
ncbi:MAG: hypothetical protein KDD61_08855 [Bdellovibrionales bacterium]|nr:hypothetical protein [Bdellovibrionales bacterium]